MTKKRLNCITSVIFLFSFLVAGTGVADSAPLSPKDQQTIKTAYMNGFVAAMEMDNETIQAVKRDENLLRQTVEAAANRYLKRVQDMNK